jgi:DNA polymerase-3 subunit epsilon
VRDVRPLHEAIRLRRTTILLDEETTGTDRRESRIIQIGAQNWHPEQGLVREWTTLVDPGIPIPPATTRVHGITDEAVRACRSCGRSREAHVPPGALAEPTRECEGFRPWPTFRQLAARLAAAWTGVDFAGKNVRFDLRIASAEFARAGVAWTYAGALVICADGLERLGEPRTLSALHLKRLGEPLEGAHDAMADVRGTARLISAQAEDFPEIPRDAEALHAALWPNYLDSEGYFTMDEDGPRVGRWGKHNGWLMRDVPADYWKFMVRKDKDFPPDAKAIAAAALAGRFPGDPPPEPQRTQGDLLAGGDGS